MSRYQDWSRAWSGIATYLVKQGFELDVRGIKGRTDRYIGVEIPKIVNKYSEHKKLRGSLTDRYLFISKDFHSFREWVKNDGLLEYKGL